MEKLYTVKETCEYLSIGRTTLWRWIKEGKIEVTHISDKAIRIKESEIKKILGE